MKKLDKKINTSEWQKIKIENAAELYFQSHRMQYKDFKKFLKALGKATKKND